MSALGVDGPGTCRVHPVDEAVLDGAARSSALHGQHLRPGQALGLGNGFREKFGKVIGKISQRARAQS